MSNPVLVRYGAISEVARFVNVSETALGRGTRVVIQSHRGIESGLLLEDAAVRSRNGHADESSPLAEGEMQILRPCTTEDEQACASLRSDCEGQFSQWQQRIRDWNLRLELIDLEWTLDKSKLILYVLNDRGPECTRLALQAAAAGLGLVEVQSVGADGLVPAETGHGCGSGGCGSGDHGESGGCCH